MTLFEQAVVLFQHRRYADAVVVCEAILKKERQHQHAMNLMGAAQAAGGAPEAAVRTLGKTLAINPANPDAHYLLGNLHREAGRMAQAIPSYRRALKQRANFAEAWINLGLASFDSGNPHEAIESYQQALVAHPAHPLALYNLGNALQSSGDLPGAMASFRKCLAVAPGNADAHYNLGNALLASGEHEVAIASFARVLMLQPAHIGAMVNLAVAQRRAGRLPDSIASSERVLQLAPANVDALNNLANALLDQGRIAEALASNDRALTVAPSNPDVLGNRGVLLLASKRHREAAVFFEALYRQSPDFPHALGNLVDAKLQGCDWAGLHALTDAVLAGVRQGQCAINPFGLLALPTLPMEQLQCAQSHVLHTIKPGVALPAIPRTPHTRIRVAYLSGDFGEHPVAQLSAGLFEHHDRARFEVFGVSLQPQPQSAMRQRLQGAFEHFVDVADRSDRDIALLLQQMEIDIAVDMSGHTQGSRPRIFAADAAPVQVNYLGYPGTTGADYMHYVLADAVVIEPGEEQHYAEQVVRLPCYLPADDRREVDAHTPTRADAGLPGDGFVFCAFNASYKITPEIFAVWMTLLRSVPGSVLWLRAASDDAVANLQAAAVAAGVAADRLVFAPRVDSMALHLARQRLADLFLDTSPYNAHSTASDALWGGVPVLTCRGHGFAGRVAASLLLTLGVPELVTGSVQEYADMALRLASEPELLQGIRARVQSGGKSSGLFDTASYCRHVEAAYLEMWRRRESGEAPGCFSIELNA